MGQSFLGLTHLFVCERRLSSSTGHSQLDQCLIVLFHRAAYWVLCSSYFKLPMSLTSLSVMVSVHIRILTTHLYYHSKAVSCSSSISRMTACMEDKKQWMTSNRLKLNNDKTQFIWLGTRQQLAKILCQIITLRGTFIHISTEVTCLGVVIDSESPFTSSVSPGDVSTNLGSFAQSDGHWALTQRRHLLMHSSQVVLITAIVFSTELVQSIFVQSRLFLMHALASLLRSGSMTRLRQ